MVLKVSFRIATRQTKLAWVARGLSLTKTQFLLGVGQGSLASLGFADTNIIHCYSLCLTRLYPGPGGFFVAAHGIVKNLDQTHV